MLALAVPGHAGGLPLPADVTTDWILDSLEAALDTAAITTAHLVGNSLGGYLALRLAARGRALTVTALAPAGGWAPDDPAALGVLDTLTAVYEQVSAVAPYADALVAQPAGRRQATALITTHFEHIPAELLAHQIRAIAAADGAQALAELARRERWRVDAAQVTCPLRIVWGTEDRVLTWTGAAAAYQAQFPHADWVVLDGVGHCPQLDVPRETAQLILGFTA